MSNEWPSERICGQYHSAFLFPPAHPHPRGFICLSQDNLKPPSQTSLHISLLPASEKHTQPASSWKSRVRRPKFTTVPRASGGSTCFSGATALLINFWLSELQCQEHLTVSFKHLQVLELLHVCRCEVAGTRQGLSKSDWLSWFSHACSDFEAQP